MLGSRACIGLKYYWFIQKSNGAINQTELNSNQFIKPKINEAAISCYFRLVFHCAKTFKLAELTLEEMVKTESNNILSYF